MKISHACAAYLRDLEAQRIRKSTRQNYQTLFRQLEAFATNSGVDSLQEIDRERFGAGESNGIARPVENSAPPDSWTRHRRAAGWRPRDAVGEALLDPSLPPQQPVEHVEHVVAADGTEAEQGTAAAGGGLRGQAASSASLEPGWSTRATMAARARSRLRLRVRCRRR